MRQYGQDPSILQSLSASDRQALLAAQRDGSSSSKAGSNPRPGQNTAADSAKTDSVISAPDSASVYEIMARRVRVNPDEILKGLKAFGYDVFARSRASTFSPVDQMAVPANYPVGVGDEVLVVLWGRINEEQRLRVDRDGKINLARIGPVSVSGLPFSVVQKNILDRVQSIEGVQASVSMGDLRSIQVFIVGEVKSPGMYTVNALTNVTNALFAAGGPTRNGSLRNIQLRRNGTTISDIDFYDFLLAGDNKTGLRLAPGDVIFVPVARKVAAVAGNVRRSAFYELKGKTDLKDLLELAGGITPAAWVNRIQVERFSDNQYQVVLDLTSESAKELPKFDIDDGDIVKIFPVVQADRNTVYLEGNVQRPGKYEFKDGMKITDVVPGYAALLPETYFDYAVVKRQEPPKFRESLIPFSLKKAFEDPSSADNVPLLARDRIVVYARDYFDPDRIVTIGGSVNTPSNQKLLENMTIRDLIIQAGGLREDASPQHGELYRRAVTGEDVVTQKLEFCVECAMNNDPQHNLVLQKYDRVFVRTKKGWQDERNVMLRGEFVFPGEYVILEGETLGDLVKRAGGFSEAAYLPGGIFTRVSARELERKRVDEYLRQLEMDIMKLSSQMASEQKMDEAQAILNQQLALQAKLRTVEPVGRVVIDLADNADVGQFLLEDGDVLMVPKKMNTVAVLGEVFNPATFTLGSRSETVSKYVEMAGGYRDQANEKAVYVVKANGGVCTRKMVSLRTYRLEPGDVVVVPQKLKYTNAFKIFTDSVDAIFKLTTIAALVTTMIIQLQK